MRLNIEKVEFYFNGYNRCLVKGCCRNTEKGKLVCSACFFGAEEQRFELAAKAREFHNNLYDYFMPLLRIYV